MESAPEGLGDAGTGLPPETDPTEWGHFERESHPDEYSHFSEHDAVGWENSRWTPGTAEISDPYCPGTMPGKDTIWPPRRGSPYAPGTAVVPDSELDPYQVAGAPSSFAWDDDTLSGERVTQSEMDSMTLGMHHVDMQSQINNVHGRVQTVDERMRADYPRVQDETYGAGLVVDTFTTDLPYDSQPTITFTPSWDSGGWWIDNWVANADGTYTFDLNVANAPVGATAITLNVKGEVADTTDIDP
jgi:hypothetical protein